MSEVEYLAGFISILVGLSVAEIAQSLHRLLSARRRVRWHWYPLAAALTLMFFTIEMWWGVGSWTVPGKPVTVGAFLPFLGGLILLYLICGAALPDEVPEQGLDLRDFYFANAPFFWTLFTVLIGQFVLVRVGRNLAYAGLDATIAVLPAVVPNLLLIVLTASLIRVKRSWWHGLMLVLLPLLSIFSMLDRPLPVEKPRPAAQAAASPMPSSPSLR